MRLWKRSLVVTLGVILVALVGVYLYFFELGGLERVAIGQLKGLLDQDKRFTISVGEVDGTLISGIILRDVTIHYADSTREFTPLYISQLTARYSLSDLLNKQYLFEEMHIDSLDLILVESDSGRWILPGYLSGDGDSRTGTSSDTSSATSLLLAVDQLILGHGRVRLMRRDTLEIDDLTLAASVRVEDGTYAAEVSSLSFTPRPMFDQMTTFVGKATYSLGNLAFQDVQISQGATRIKASGTLNPKEQGGAAEVAIDNLDLAEVSSLLGGKLSGVMDVNGRVAFVDRQLRGQLSLGGDFLLAAFDNLYTDFTFSDRKLRLDTLYGTILGNCGIDGRGEVDFTGSTETYRLYADIRNFDLKQLLEGTFQSDLSGSMELSGQSFSNDNMLLCLDVDLYESAFDEYPLHRARGELEITTDSIRFVDGFQVDYFENSFYADGVIDYDENMYLEVTADLRNLDRYRGKLFIDQPGGRARGVVTLSGRSNDPDLRGHLTSDSLWVYGLYTTGAHAEFDIARFLTGRRGWVTADLDHGAAWSMPYDSGAGVIRLDSNLIRIDTVGLNNEYADISACGTLDQGQYPWVLTLDRFDLTLLERRFSNTADLHVNIDTLGFDFLETSIGQGAAALTVDGRINYDESMALTLGVAGVPIRSWLGLIDQELEVDGFLSGRADLFGTFMSPAFVLESSIDSLTYENVVLGDVIVSARYRDSLVTIDSLEILAPGGDYKANGYFYADLAFTADERQLFPDLPFDLSVAATDNRFDLVSVLLPSVENLEGDLYADFRLDGTPAEPHLSGSAFLRDGRLKYFDLADTLKTDSAGLIMRDNQIVMDDIEVYVYDRRKNRNSYVVVDGVLTVKSLDTLHYDLDITIPKEFPFKYELDDIEGVVEGDVHVYGDTPPTVTGDLTLISARYNVEFSSEDEGSPLMTALSGENTWDLDLNIDVLSNLWIKNQDIDAELSGYMNLIREDGRYRFIGELEILKGKGYLFDKTFRIESGSTVTFEDIEHPNPELDITATTRIPVVYFEEETSHSQVEELSINITGTLENPEFDTVEDDTTFTKEDILPLIVANYYGSGSDPTGAGRLEQRLSQFISSKVSQIGSRQLGVETFEIDPAYEGELNLSSTRVTLGVYTTSSLYLYGRSAVSFDHGQEVGFEYHFNKDFMLEGRRDESDLYHVNVKLHWEF